MTPFRILVLCVLIGNGVLAATPGRADSPAPAAPVAAPVGATGKLAAAPTPGSFEDSTWGGPGGIYRVVAASAGVLAGAVAMSVVIDGWVVDSFARSGGMTLAEARELVQDFDSQGGFEAAAIVLSGLAGGLMADHLYVRGVEVLPGAVAAAGTALQPPLTAVGNAWGWLGDRVGDGSDWVQARSREAWDRCLQWSERWFPPARSPLPPPPHPTTAK